ncbi:phage tail protein [Xylanibacillus composti]|uniref:Microcystin dependent MdpB family protein n=1 Tax=Xylanibacillus composti TaxID=1572762 RepID=A0A8J4M3D4_9BACL|nr:tail fiber protein [Xylanibacillus composti]MDT9726519.1 phage tail protein [Xylanibacillus composti]GIQ69907.1 microcystin dependent MdpB family protein [Xylanibacillus composti]
MADAYIGEIRIFAGNFAPRDWHFCDGSLLPISQNSALYSILGTRYGGDGKSTFALPDLMGRAPMGQGAGPGLTSYEVGQKIGAETVTLLSTQMPAHNHVPQGNAGDGNKTEPTNHYWSEQPGGRLGKENTYASTPNAIMSPMALAAAGQSLPHNNMQPYLAMNYIICLYGDMPLRG